MAVGRRWTWWLDAEGLQLAVWETQWSTGERDVVLGSQELEGSMPLMVAKLMSRRRALVEGSEQFEFMSARRVDPDSDGWPRFSACTHQDIQELVPPHAEAQIRALGYLGVISRQEALNADGPNRRQLIARFVPGARVASVSFYALTRIVPTLRRAGFLGG